MKISFQRFFLLFFGIISFHSFPQKIIENYEPLKNDSIRIGPGDRDFLPFIKNGYTIMLPENDTINGVLIFLEDAKYDGKNRSAKQVYRQATEKGFAVLSVSTEIPLDFYFSEASMFSVHRLIKEVFSIYSLPQPKHFLFRSRFSWT